MQSFFDEFRKGACSALNLWHHMEAIAFFFCGDDQAIGAWYSKSEAGSISTSALTRLQCPMTVNAIGNRCY